MLSVSLVGAVATTMMLVLAMREVDLSVGSLVALSGVLTAEVIANTGSVALGVGAGLAAGAVVGLINGFVVARLRINSLIATLAMMEIVRGAGVSRFRRRGGRDPGRELLRARHRRVAGRWLSGVDHAARASSSSALC